MAMEGINWGEVNNQVGLINQYLDSLERDSVQYFQNLVDELAYYWASGNAVTSGDHYTSIVYSYFNVNIFISRGRINDAIIHAGEIYARTFNVDSQINIPPNSIPYFRNFTNPFEKSVRGFSGMNKKAVDECYENYKSKIKSNAEEIAEKVKNIHLSIFDEANLQREAFDLNIEDMLHSIDRALKLILEDIKEKKEEEENNLHLAKQQTVNTFNA